MCHWSKEHKDCVVGSVKMCEPYKESSCALDTECRWYSNDKSCVTPQVYKNFERTSTAKEPVKMIELFYLDVFKKCFEQKSQRR